MATRVALPTDLANWPKLKRHLEALKRIKPNPEELVKALDELHDEYILNYLTPAAGSGSGRSFFTGLRRFLEQHMSDSQRKRFFESLLPFLVDRVLALETHREPLHYACQQDASVTLLSREFVSSLLSAAFLCLMPQHPKDLAVSMSTNGFPAFFADIQEATPHQAEKMHCVLSYFDQLQRDGPPSGKLAIIRSLLPSEDLLTAAKLASSSRPLCRLLVEPEATMDSAGTDLLQVCFGNSFLGGGVLWTGVLQEETLFVHNPELITSMLFVEAMDNNEAVYIMGYEPFSRSEGYGLKMKFAGQVRNSLEPDEAGIQPRRLVSMDAVPYRGFPAEQYVEQNLMRDINKAYVAFRQSYKQCRELPSGFGPPRGVATGNWGCGAFGGDPQLKAMLQWLVASQLELPVLQYHKFADSRVARLEEVSEKLQSANCTIGQLWKRILDYCAIAGEEFEKTEALQTELFAHLLKTM